MTLLNQEEGTMREMRTKEISRGQEAGIKTTQDLIAIMIKEMIVITEITIIEMNAESITMIEVTNIVQEILRIVEGKVEETIGTLNLQGYILQGVRTYQSDIKEVRVVIGEAKRVSIRQGVTQEIKVEIVRGAARVAVSDRVQEVMEMLDTSNIKLVT